MTTHPHRHRVASRCLASRHGADAVTRLATGKLDGIENLRPAEAQALADLLPLLICGEESAAILFDDMVNALHGKISAALLDSLKRIAEDEVRHSQYLDCLRLALPAPRDGSGARRAATFLRRLNSTDPAHQLARIAALDAAVCRVLANILRPNTPLAAARGVAQLLRNIHRDEGRHVRVTRHVIRALGVSAEFEAAQREIVLSGFARLLLPVSNHLLTLKFDLRRMIRHWHAAPPLATAALAAFAA